MLENGVSCEYGYDISGMLSSFVISTAGDHEVALKPFENKLTSQKIIESLQVKLFQLPPIVPMTERFLNRRTTVALLRGELGTVPRWRHSRQLKKY